VLQPERNLTHPPFFQVMLVLQNAPMEELELPGLTLKPVPVHKGTAGFDLELSLTEKQNGLEGWLEYNTDLFDSATVQRIAGHFKTLLHGVVEDPNRRLSEFSILTPHEQIQLRHEANNAHVPGDQLVHHIFEQQVKRTPDAIAIVSGDESVTFAELNHRATVVATSLVELGIEPDNIVALLTEPSIEMLSGMLAVLKSGAAYLLLDPLSFTERHQQIIAHSRCAAVLGTTNSISSLRDETFGAHPPILAIDEVTQQFAADELAPKCTPSNLATVVYHADSDEAVMIEHQALSHHLSTRIAALQLSAGDNVAEIASPLSHRSVSTTFAALLAGATVHIFSDDVACSTTRFNEELAQQSISILNGMPPVLKALVDEAGAELQDLRAIVWHGESLPAKLVGQWLVEHPQVQLFNTSGWNEFNQIVDRDAFVLDRKQSLVPAGIDGELYLGGAGIGRGYLNDARRTAAEFIPNPFSSVPGARIFKTGELAAYLPDGNIKSKGRIERQFKVRGCHVAPGEIEAALLEYPSISEAVVVASDDDEQRLTAYVVFADAEESAEQNVREFLEQRLPRYLVPTLCVLDVLPRTSAGDVDRRALPEPVADSAALSAAFVGARTPTEQVVSGIWQEVLGLSRIGIHDKFFELGGDSLKLLRTYLLLNELYPDALTVADLFKHSTIEFVSSHLDSTYMNTQAAEPAIQGFEL
jgi:non-ribosomal peptide synthetase component F